MIRCVCLKDHAPGNGGGRFQWGPSRNQGILVGVSTLPRVRTVGAMWAGSYQPWELTVGIPLRLNVSSCWWLEIGHSGNFYTTNIGKWQECFPERGLLDICQRITEWQRLRWAGVRATWRWSIRCIRTKDKNASQMTCPHTGNWIDLLWFFFFFDMVTIYWRPTLCLALVQIPAPTELTFYWDGVIDEVRARGLARTSFSLGTWMVPRWGISVISTQLSALLYLPKRFTYNSN